MKILLKPKTYIDSCFTDTGVLIKHNMVCLNDDVITKVMKKFYNKRNLKIRRTSQTGLRVSNIYFENCWVLCQNVWTLT